MTSTVSDYRREPFALLAQEEGVEIVAFAEGGPDSPAPFRRETQASAVRLAASGRYRAIVCGLGGRIALPGCFLATRRTRAPFVLWASIWSHPRTPAHALSYLPTRFIYRHADAVVTYGPHVSAYVAARRGTRHDVFEAAQAVSAEHFGAPVSPERRAATRERAGARPDAFLLLFVGRLEREKGVRVLMDAWRRASLGPDARLALAGEGPLRAEVRSRGDGRVRTLGQVARADLPALYAAADALVLPSVPTATFREPWGLVVNEAMHQGTPSIVTDAVGAAAGGLVRNRRNGLVVRAGDSEALADGITLLGRDERLRADLADAARADVATFNHEAWVSGMSRALEAVGASRRGVRC